MTHKASHPTFALILKRRRWSIRDAEVVLSAWRESGDSLSQFARRHGLEAWRLMRWRRQLTKGAAIQFHRVKVVPPPSLEDGVGHERGGARAARGSACRGPPGLRRGAARGSRPHGGVLAVLTLPSSVRI